MSVIATCDSALSPDIAPRPPWKLAFQRYTHAFAGKQKLDSELQDGCASVCVCVCQTLVPRDFSSIQTMTENAGAPGMHDLAWCNEAPVMHQDMVEGRFSHVPARTAP